MRRGGAPRIFFLAAAALRRSKKTSKNGWGLIGRVGLNQAFCLDITRPFERKRVLSKRVRGLYPPGMSATLASSAMHGPRAAGATRPSSQGAYLMKTR